MPKIVYQNKKSSIDSCRIPWNFGWLMGTFMVTCEIIPVSLDSTFEELCNISQLVEKASSTVPVHSRITTCKRIFGILSWNIKNNAHITNIKLNVSYMSGLSEYILSLPLKWRFQRDFSQSNVPKISFRLVPKSHETLSCWGIFFDGWKSPRPIHPSVSEPICSMYGIFTYIWPKFMVKGSLDEKLPSYEVLKMLRE